jgi:ribose 5-phosphate isomerase RpiB
MKLAEAEIERVVREVLARLAIAPAAAPNGQAAAIQDATSLNLDRRLVTLEDLNGRLRNHQSVTVPTGAVVTPAARDHLRERKVALLRRDAASQSGRGSARLAFGLTETHYDASDLMKQLATQGIKVERLSAGGLPEVMDRAAERVTSDASLGLVVTGQSTAAVCLANRRPGIRAACAKQVADVEAAIVEIGVNLLVIDPRGQSSFALRQMISKFCTGAPHPCPEALKSRLA